VSLKDAAAAAQVAGAVARASAAGVAPPRAVAAGAAAQKIAGERSRALVAAMDGAESAPTLALSFGGAPPPVSALALASGEVSATLVTRARGAHLAVPLLRTRIQGVEVEALALAARSLARCALVLGVEVAKGSGGRWEGLVPPAPLAAILSRPRADGAGASGNMGDTRVPADGGEEVAEESARVALVAAEPLRLCLSTAALATLGALGAEARALGSGKGGLSPRYWVRNDAGVPLRVAVVGAEAGVSEAIAEGVAHAAAAAAVAAAGCGSGLGAAAAPRGSWLLLPPGVNLPVDLPHDFTAWPGGEGDGTAEGGLRLAIALAEGAGGGAGRAARHGASPPALLAGHGVRPIFCRAEGDSTSLAMLRAPQFPFLGSAEEGGEPLAVIIETRASLDGCRRVRIRSALLVANRLQRTIELQEEGAPLSDAARIAAKAAGADGSSAAGADATPARAPWRVVLPPLSAAWVPASLASRLLAFPQQEGGGLRGAPARRGALARRAVRPPRLRLALALSAARALPSALLPSAELDLAPLLADSAPAWGVTLAAPPARAVPLVFAAAEGGESASPVASARARLILAAHAVASLTRDLKFVAEEGGIAMEGAAPWTPVPSAPAAPAAALPRTAAVVLEPTLSLWNALPVALDVSLAALEDGSEDSMADHVEGEEAAQAEAVVADARADAAVAALKGGADGAGA
jgi:hypothetical protein